MSQRVAEGSIAISVSLQRRLAITTLVENLDEGKGQHDHVAVAEHRPPGIVVKVHI